jgi:hypothetical protein
MMLALLPLSMCRHPCHCQPSIVALVTMASLSLICNGVVALIAMASLQPSSWHHCPCCNGIVVIINVIALVSCHQAGVITLVVMVLLLSMCRHLCHCCIGNCRSCHDGIVAVVELALSPLLLVVELASLPLS